MKHSHKFLDFFAMLLGISCVDWDTDFASDGYHDPSGLAPLNEALIIGHPNVEISVINTERQHNLVIHA
ncbi:MAG: hypothetical protein RR009_06440 [Oscillospiraceae bacterium]